MAEPVTTPAQLALAVQGQSDETLNSWTTERGADAILTPIFEGMRDRFLPDKAVGKRALIQYDITTPQGVTSWRIEVADGVCTATPGAGDEPTCNILMSFPNFLRLVTGGLNPVMAFMSGKLKVKGDLMTAQNQANWFDQRITPEPATAESASGETAAAGPTEPS